MIQPSHMISKDFKFSQFIVQHKLCAVYIFKFVCEFLKYNQGVLIYLKVCLSISTLIEALTKLEYSEGV